MPTPPGHFPLVSGIKRQLSRHNPTPAVIVFIAAAALTLFFCWRLRVLAADDSYIHLRISQHLMATGHPYFNIGEEVMVTSSPVWTLMLGLASLAFVAIPPAIPLEMLSVASASMLGYLISRRLARSYGTPTTLQQVLPFVSSLFIWLALVQSAILQMETATAVSLILLAVYLLISDNRLWLATLMAAVFVRYECVVVALSLTIFAMFIKRLSRPSLILGGICLGAAITWLELQFGTVVPNTFHAKAIAYVIPASQTATIVGMASYRLLLLPVIAVILLYSGKPTKRTVGTCLMLAGLTLIGTYIWRRAFIFPWYLPLFQVPLTFGLLLCALTSGRRLVQISSLSAALIFLPLHSLREELPAGLLSRPWQDHADDGFIKVREYLTVGGAVNDVCPKARLMTSEIGGLGEAFHGEILDGFGLASPEATRFHPMKVPQERSEGGIGAIPLGYFNEQHPDIVVSYDYFSEYLRAHYDKSAYSEFSYRPLPAAGATHYRLWTANKLYILVANSGACVPSVVDEAVTKALEDGGVAL